MQLLNLAVVFLLFDPEVQTLIEQMGNDTFVVREEAYSKLRKMDERPIKLLKIASISHKDIEIKKRSKRLVDSYEFSLVPTDYDAIPWIDHLPEGFANRGEILKKYLGPYQHLHEWDSTGNYGIFRSATKDFILNYSRAGHTKKQCVELLDKMAASEKKWKACNCNTFKCLPKELEE